MATALEDTSVLEKELTCPVCLDLYREPHLLRCGHNFCLQCLQRLKSLSEHGHLRCPECRKSHHCSNQWQKNFKLASIADGFRQCRRSPRPNQSRPGSSYRTTEVCCDYCWPDITGHSAKRSRAVKTCLKCEVSMCPEHVKHHLELPAFREHPLVEPLSDMRKRKCIEHDKMFRYYCMDDRKFLCNACKIEGGHNRHAIKTLKNTMKDLRGSLDTQLQKVDKMIRRVEKNMQKQREVEQQNKALLVQVDRQVDTLRGVLMSRLDGFLSSLRKCVRSYEWENSLNIQQALVRTEEDWSRLGVVHAGIKQLLQENDPFQFIKEYMSCAKSYHRLLKRPLFQPQAVTMDIKERMERKREDFMTDLWDHITMIINTVCTGGLVNEGDEGVEEGEMEDDIDINEDENDSSDGDEEQEEEVYDHSDSASDLSTEEEGELELGKVDKMIRRVETNLQKQREVEQQNKALVRTEEDWSRLGVVHARMEQLLQENDPFQFIKEYMSCAKSYHRLLKRPLFQPQAVTMDTEVIEECMEGNLTRFCVLTCVMEQL